MIEIAKLGMASCRYGVAFVDSKTEAPREQNADNHRCRDENQYGACRLAHSI
jgi:hypothetical protein